jgi:hypothetical protein
MRAILLASPEEQNNGDIHRVDGEQWTGQTISDLDELLKILD